MELTFAPRHATDIDITTEPGPNPLPPGIQLADGLIDGMSDVISWSVNAGVRAYPLSDDPRNGTYLAFSVGVGWREGIGPDDKVLLFQPAAGYMKEFGRSFAADLGVGLPVLVNGANTQQYLLQSSLITFGLVYRR